VRVPFEEHLPQEQVQEIRTRIVAAVRDVVDAARCDADLDKVISSNFFVKIGERNSSAAASATFGEHAKQLRNLTSFEVERVIAAAKEMSGRGVPVDQMCDALMPSATPPKKQKQRVA
jgi:shikimate kinase